jgi:hypothetical protein
MEDLVRYGQEEYGAERTTITKTIIISAHTRSEWVPWLGDFVVGKELCAHHTTAYAELGSKLKFLGSM